MPHQKTKHSKKRPIGKAKLVAKAPVKKVEPERPTHAEKRPRWPFRRKEKISAEQKVAIIAARKPLPPARLILVRSLKLLWEQRKLLGGILLVYALVDLVLVGGAGADLQSTKNSLVQAAHGHPSHLSTGITLFAFLISSGGSAASGAASAYQTILLLLVSIVFIWALRQIFAEHKVTVRESFYTGPYPMVPFVLVLVFLGIELIPMVATGALYNILVGGKIFIGFFEDVLAGAIFALGTYWSFYMITAAVIALYVVTVPGITPMGAISSGRELVRFRRILVLRKILFLVVVLLVAGAIILIPTALFLTPIATWLFFILTVLAIGLVHTYLYSLYRELL